MLSMSSTIQLSDEQVQDRLHMIRSLVAKPIPETPSWTDPQPALIDTGCVLIGNKHHAANVQNLLNLGVTAVLNCASGGISRLPVAELQESGIQYAFTNCNQDNYSYPILHDYDTSACSKHLQVAKELYSNVWQAGGRVLFFCVAGQNRSATLAIAVMMLFGHSLDSILSSCAMSRSFILENVGFQKQLVELEALLLRTSTKETIKNHAATEVREIYRYGTPMIVPVTVMTKSESDLEALSVEIELLIPGLCTMDTHIPIESTIADAKKRLIDHANKHLLANNIDDDTTSTTTIAKSWVVLAMFGYDSMYDIPLEVEAIELSVQLERMQTMFGLQVKSDGNETLVRWNDKCRFALVILSVSSQTGDAVIQKPWTFVHEERPGAPATLLENTLMSTSLRAWDFVTGQAFCSVAPIVFSFADDPRDKRQFMKISTSAHEAQQFHAPGEGGILGMGNNAIVHRVELKPTSSSENKIHQKRISILSHGEKGWDAAVKRPFSLSKMLAALENSSEAGLAKRMRFANSLNSDGRVLFFYGLGVALSANAYNHQEYKFEATLLARYEEEFSTYTMKRFMDDYIAIPGQAKTEAQLGRVVEIAALQAKFTLISVKVILVSLLNAFRDLTLMGVQAFDFNHMNNVLISRDHRTVRLIDIDGDSKGSIQFPSEYIQGASFEGRHHKPSLDVDLNAVLPTAVQQLILGKGRGFAFVRDKKSEIWRANEEDAKEIIKTVIRENFFSHIQGEESAKAEKHIGKVAEWFYALSKKASPWDNWTNDIYDAMRCIDHLPVT
jgi:protein-tyrosine phosphatase